MPDFSYESSIAPYAGSLFKRVDSNPFLTSARKADLSEGLLASLENAKTRADKEEARTLDVELSRTRLDANRLALEDARQEMQLKRTAVAQAPAVNSEFEKILDSVDLNKEEKNARISRLAMNNAEAFTLSPTLKAKYAFAMRATKKPDSAFTPYQEFTARHTLESDARNEDRYQKEQADKEGKLAQDEMTKEREWLDKAVDVEFEKQDPVTDLDPVSKKLPPKQFKSPAHRERLLDLVSKYAPDEADAAEQLSPEDLYKKASNVRRKLLSSTYSASRQGVEPPEKLYNFR